MTARASFRWERMLRFAARDLRRLGIPRGEAAGVVARLRRELLSRLEAGEASSDLRAFVRWDDTGAVDAFVGRAEDRLACSGPDAVVRPGRLH